MYQILVFELDSIPSIFFVETNKNELVISNNFFAVFKEKRLYYYHEIEEKVDLEELKLYLLNQLKFLVEKVTIYDKIQNSLNKNFIENYNFIKIKKSPLFRVFLAYIIFLIVFIMYSVYSLDIKDEKVDELSALNQKFIAIKGEKKFYPLSPILIKVFEDIKKYNLDLKSFNIKNNQVNLEIVSKKKVRVYEMLKSYSNTNIDSIQFDESKEVFVVNASFRIFRK